VVRSPIVAGRSKRDVVVEFRTNEILTAANRVFAERGFDGATVAEIASAAGVAKGTVYLYYRSKKEVYWATLGRSLEELRDKLTAAVEETDGAAAALRAYLTTKLAFCEANSDFFRIYFGAFGHPAGRPDGAGPQLDRHVLAQVELLAGVMRAAEASGEVRSVDAMAVAFAIVALTRGVIGQRLRGWTERPLEDDVSTLFDLVWNGIGRS
jgi:AcrR family transcriptional regulator